MNRVFLLVLFVTLPRVVRSDEPVSGRVDEVTNTPGLVAFWDFVKREPEGQQRRFTAHVPTGASTDYALDAGNYVRDY